MLVRRYLDKVAPRPTERWVSFFVLLLFFMYRVIRNQTHYAVCYALWIYLLNSFILFLSPFTDPEDADEQHALPKSHDDEFRPFARRLPEMSFWTGAAVSVTVSIISTLFAFFNIPVYWPVLLVYFIMISFLMLRAQIQHMLKHHYIPFDIGKKKYREGEIRL